MSTNNEVTQASVDAAIEQALTDHQEQRDQEYRDLINHVLTVILSMSVGIGIGMFMP